MRDLLDHQTRLSNSLVVGPNTIEELSQHRVQGLFLRAHLLITGLLSVLSVVCCTREAYRVLALEGCDEPFENALNTVLRGLALRDSSEQVRMFTPVRRELGQRGWREDDCSEQMIITLIHTSLTWGSGHRRQIGGHARERLDEARPSCLLLLGNVGSCHCQQSRSTVKRWRVARKTPEKMGAIGLQAQSRYGVRRPMKHGGPTCANKGPGTRP